LVKDPGLNVFVGESGLGKSTLINTLFNSIIYPQKEEKELTQDTPKTIDIQAISAGMVNLCNKF
jgi:septin family protein